MTLIHLDTLDVIRDCYPSLTTSTPLPKSVNDSIELFGQTVMPPLFGFVNEAPLGIVLGLLGLVMERTALQGVVRTKVGVSVLTMLISRAELLRQSQAQSQGESAGDWQDLYARLFDAVEPVLPYLFAAGEEDDVHIWQFLAAMGVGASPDQQQRLVLGVKERVMEVVGKANGMEEGSVEKERRLGVVNLFMRAIGLDVGLLG